MSYYEDKGNSTNFSILKGVIKMTIGFRAFLEIERPDKDLIERFRGLPSSNIGDCVRKMNCMFDGLRAYNNKPLLGTAFTVKVPTGDNLVAQVALDYAMEGDIIVIDGSGYTDRALIGGMMLQYAQMRKLGGFVVNGALRDVDDIVNGSIQVFAKGVTPLGPYREGPGEINVPVVCGGQVVLPGDILVGDADGLVVIHPNDAEAILLAAQENLANEQDEIKRMKNGLFTKTEHRKRFENIFLTHGGTFEKNKYNK